MTRRTGPRHAQSRRLQWLQVPGVFALVVTVGVLVGSAALFAVVSLLAHGTVNW